MYIIRLAISNPMTGDSVAVVYKFDPATLTQAKWNTAFPAVQVQLNELMAASTPKEVATW